VVQSSFATCRNSLSDMRFGISTHLYHDKRLEQTHLAEIAAYGFDAVELFATRSHFDYRDEGAVGRLAEWLSATGLELHSVHAPITDVFGSGGWAATFSNALADGPKRTAAVQETAAALSVARLIPFKVMVVHLGTPASKNNPGDNNRAAAIRSVDEICKVAEPLGVRIALEVIPNRLSDAASLVSLLDDEIETSQAGICLDFGHAHLMGDVPETVETAAEHLITTHVHDNHGREDEHLAPYHGAIDWDAALITMQKFGYAGTYMMELANTGSPKAVLEAAREARGRFERTLAYS
jgi:sugar phosphate isomerase/epimerase